MEQHKPSNSSALVRLSPISIITTSWIISIQNTVDYTLMRESDVRFKYRRKLPSYIDSHLPRPTQSRQINELYSTLDRVAVELLANGLSDKNSQRPEYLLPQIQMAIEPHYQGLSKAYSGELIARLF
ncbi:hypothetical protein ST37_02410 (plasmid) [Vibrio sp. qd031]|nr:hypothetical protein ST37_02410 [Vibrio sp. qd031]